MLRAAVPEAAIHENSDALAFEGEVRFDRPAFTEVDRLVEAEADP